MNSQLAIIGGTGLTTLNELKITHQESINTPYGSPSSPLVFGSFNEISIIFLARHGENHSIPPHKINYRANIAALKQVGVTHILAVAAVGGIQSNMKPGNLAIPDQLIDYSYGRKQTFFEDDDDPVEHIDFTLPYSDTLRQQLIKVANSNEIELIKQGTYGCTQGPRLETAAEIERMRRDGCDLVGMTGMPEAGLAREKGIQYACCTVVANWAAGISGDTISMDTIMANLEGGMKNVKSLIHGLLSQGEDFLIISS